MTSANAALKIYIENMPEALNTKKDIDEYIKEFWKDFREKAKEAKAAKAEKPKRKKGVDKDGNPKEKRAPSQYNIFVKEQYEIIKNANPELDKTQIFAEIGKIWKEKKGDNNEKPAKKVEETKMEEDDNVEIEEEKPVEAPKKKQGRKAIKKKPNKEEKSDEDE